jgi:hypothetical protein
MSPAALSEAGGASCVESAPGSDARPANEPMKRIRLYALAVGIAHLVLACGLGDQAITDQWRPLRLSRVPTTRADEARLYDSSSVVVQGTTRGAVLRWTIDNSCGDRMQLAFREAAPRTLALRRLGDWETHQACPAVLALETYVATITDLSPGHWRVLAGYLAAHPAPDFDVR